MELDIPLKEYVGFSTICELQRTSFVNSQSTILTMVCRESRAVAFENAGYIDEILAEAEPGKPYGWFGGGNAIFDQWFSPATDIVHLNWDPNYDSILQTRSNPISFFLWLASKGIAASINAELVHPFDPPPYYGDTSEDFDLLDHRKDYLVTLRMISLHVDKDLAIRSGLFGRLGEERIKLVDPADKVAMIRYHELWAAGPREDQEPAAFFEGALSTESYLERIKKWNEELDRLWLRRKYLRAEETNFTSIEDPEHVWLEHRRDKNGRPIDYQLSPFGARMKVWFPNTDHPWVKKEMEQTPRFTPRIMFRLCQQKCYMPKRS
jgi:hypothetical protein